jgi:hypothetical protein
MKQDKRNIITLPKWEHVVGAVAMLILIGLLVTTETGTPTEERDLSGDMSLEARVLPKEGVVLPITWGDIGVQMVEAGVIDAPRFEALYEGLENISTQEKNLLYEHNNENVVITRENAGVLLNMFWAFGLANKNEILEEGPMTDEIYGGDPSRFASTGGWSLAVGDPMNHYAKHAFVSLTQAQQQKVESVAKGIYRPCCGNSTYFPDCNHGMAMLGLLQLLAAEGASEDEMFDVALRVNSYWFPETYMTLASYFEQKGTSWNEIDPRRALGTDYSSGSGYQRILQEMEPVKLEGAGSCSV